MVDDILSIATLPETVVAKDCLVSFEDKFAAVIAECRSMQAKTQDLQVQCTEARCRTAEAEQELIKSRAAEVDHVNHLWQLGQDLSKQLRHETAQVVSLRTELAKAHVQLENQQLAHNMECAKLQERLVEAQTKEANQFQRVEVHKKRIADLQVVLRDAQSMLVNAKEVEDEHAHQHEFSEQRIAELEHELNEALVAGLNTEMEMLRDVEAKALRTPASIGQSYRC